MFNREESERAPAVVGLADTLSGLLRQAVEDAQVVEKMEGYALRMRVWHQPAYDLCEVCMAGATMARRLNTERTIERVPADFDYELCGKLTAIDYLRIGLVAYAARDLGMWPTPEPPVFQEYRDLIGAAMDSASYRAPWDVYLRGADMLEAAGL